MLDVLGDDFYYGGVVTGADKWRVLAENDVFLLPSKYEGLPMALLEAMAAGCVPVVSNVGSIATVVEDGVNGVFVNENDVAERLDDLLSGRFDLAEMSGRATATIRERFDIRDYVEKLTRIYRRGCPRNTLKTRKRREIYRDNKIYRDKNVRLEPRINTN